MSEISANRGSSRFTKFERELRERVGGIDLASTSSNKFTTLAVWLAASLGFPPEKVICKYAPDSKNLWNRVREGVRGSPSCLVLMHDAEASEELLDGLERECSLCSGLKLLLLVIGSGDSQNAMKAVLKRTGEILPLSLSGMGGTVPVREFSDARQEEALVRVGDTGTSAGKDLRAALSALGGRRSFDQELRARATSCLAGTTGLPADRIVIKQIADTKNLGNRISEGLGRAPRVLVVVCPDVLQTRVLEEYDSSPANHGDGVLITVLRGEEIDLSVDGAAGELLKALRELIGRDEPVATGEPAPHAVNAFTKVLKESADLEGGAFDWESWGYPRWNRELVDYCLAAAGEGEDTVERLPATPEELAEVVGADSEVASRVAAAFVDSCLAEIPKGKGFCRYCRDFRKYSVYPNGRWSPKSPDYPHFFGMLWFTALICYGYPDAQGGFHERARRLFGHPVPVACLSELWRFLRAWTIRRRRSGERFRELVIPPDDSFRKNIGHSYFLAFPHQQDRGWLSRALEEAELVGFEPPIRPVVLALQRVQDRFSVGFRDDFREFTTRYFELGEAAERSAFWRAVRQSALNPTVGKKRLVYGKTTLLAVFDDDEFVPLIGCRKDWTPPDGFQVDSPEGWMIAGWQSHVQTESGDFRKAVEIAFAEEAMLGPGPRTMLRQGVLVFQEDAPHGYYLASGQEIAEADVALVRDGLVDAFIGVFGGRAEASFLEGWKVVQDCVVLPLADPPADLSGVYVLQKSMGHPQVRILGGIRLPDGYLALKGLLPTVRASGARRVVIESGGQQLECCARDGENQLWQLPDEIVERANEPVRVVAEWPDSRGDGARLSHRRLPLRTAVIDDRFKHSPVGHFFRESCRPAQQEFQGGGDVPLDVSTTDPSIAADFLPFDPTCRWLGPGLGEMALGPRTGFDWMAVGDKGHPEALYFVGDPANPTPLEDRVSPDKGDKSHWRCAFRKADRYYTQGKDGKWEDIDESAHPLIAEALEAYRGRISCPSDAPKVQITDLETVRNRRPERHESSEPTMNLVDALAALSVNRSGLRYREVQDLFSEITGRSDYRLHHELIRAWCEQGCLDQLRDQAYGYSVIVARKPRFVAYRRGPAIEATLVGLVTAAKWSEVSNSLDSVGATRIEKLSPGCFWQPRMLRVRGEEHQLRRVVEEVGLEPTEWLRWDCEGEVAAPFDATFGSQQFRGDEPPGGYSLERRWDWEAGLFRRGHSVGKGQVSIEQRSRDGRSTIYVVRAVEGLACWTYVRNWALLVGHELAGRPPFVVDEGGWVLTDGRGLVHLPLTMGRVCAIAGDGIPGPLLDKTGRTVESYCYPFGRQLTDVVSRALPRDWVRT